MLTALQWESTAAPPGPSRIPKEDLGERHVPHDLACFILDLDGMVPWILAAGGEHINETLGRAQRSAAGRLHIGEVEPECVIAPTMAGAANVNEEARHGGCKG
jgi:hypothetical protein